MGLRVLVGDATAPARTGPGIIVHVCNDVGGWGRGFVVAVSQRWPEPERRYRAWSKGLEAAPPFALGQVQLVPVGPDLWVANLIGQRGLRTEKGQPPVRYEAIRQGLATVAERALATGASVHMPRIGCGLAGGRWEAIEPIVTEALVSRGIEVFVYDLP